MKIDLTFDPLLDTLLTHLTEKDWCGLATVNRRFRYVRDIYPTLSIHSGANVLVLRDWIIRRQHTLHELSLHIDAHQVLYNLPCLPGVTTLHLSKTCTKVLLRLMLQKLPNLKQLYMDSGIFADEYWSHCKLEELHSYHRQCHDLQSVSLALLSRPGVTLKALTISIYSWNACETAFVQLLQGIKRLSVFVISGFSDTPNSEADVLKHCTKLQELEYVHWSVPLNVYPVKELTVHSRIRGHAEYLENVILSGYLTKITIITSLLAGRKYKLVPVRRERTRFDQLPDLYWGTLFKLANKNGVKLFIKTDHGFQYYFPDSTIIHSSFPVVIIGPEWTTFYSGNVPEWFLRPRQGTRSMVYYSKPQQMLHNRSTAFVSSVS